MKRLRAGLATGMAIILGLIILATVVRPLLPWLLVAFVFACILGVVTRDP